MVLDPQLAQQHAQTIRVQAVQTDVVNNRRGDRAYAANTIRFVKARIELRDDIVEKPPGNFRQTTHWIATEERIGDRDQIWLPGQDPATDQPRIPASVQEVPNERGDVDHFEVKL